MEQIIEIVGAYSKNGSVFDTYTLYKVKIRDIFNYYFTDTEDKIIYEFTSLDKARKKIKSDGFVEMLFCLETWSKD